MAIRLNISIFLLLTSCSTLVIAENFLNKIFDRKGFAFHECTEIFEASERLKVITAAERPVASFGSTYIPTNKGEWMVVCMSGRDFHLAINSLSRLNSTELAKMSREQINAAREADVANASINLNAWK